YPAIAILIGTAISSLLHAKSRGRRSGVEAFSRADVAEPAASRTPERPNARTPGAERPELARACAGMFVVGFLALAAAAVVLAVTQQRTGPHQPLVDPESPYYVFFFSPIFHLSRESLRTLRVPAVVVAASLFAGTSLALHFSIRSLPRPALLALA